MDTNFSPSGSESIGRITAEILDRERSHHDEIAQAQDDRSLEITEDDLERYRNARARPQNFAKDALFALLLPIRDKQVLDYGCGLGDNSCLLAACGAKVSAFDLSPISITKAKRKAEMLGLASRIQFSVQKAGCTNFPSGSFDVLLGFNILHHLHQDLEPIYQEINRLVGPSGEAFFLEPVANSWFLRGMRTITPLEALGKSPDERQLIYTDLEPLRRYFSRIDYFHFRFISRLDRFLSRRFAQKLNWLDYYLQCGLPFLRRYYGKLVIRARR